MAHDDISVTDRRTFLQAGAVAAASGLEAASAADAQETAPKPMIA
jgi:hypothetical protein